MRLKGRELGVVWFVYFCLEYMYIEMREERKKVERRNLPLILVIFQSMVTFAFSCAGAGSCNSATAEAGPRAGAAIIQVNYNLTYLLLFVFVRGPLLMHTYNAEAKLPHSFISFYPQLP